MRIFLLVLLFLVTAANAANLNFNISFVQDSVSGIQDSIIHSDSSSLIQDSTKNKRTAFKPFIFEKNIQSENNYGFNIYNVDLFFTDYRFTGDLFNIVPFGFLKSTGLPGLISEAKIYGLGFNNVSYLSNGNLLNNRLNNSFDLNYIALETLKKIEIIPLPRGFLYGNSVNPAAINLVKDSYYPVKPVSKLRIFLGTEEEGRVNVFFNSFLLNKMPFYFDVNHISYNGNSAISKNNSFSSWQIEAGTGYYFSDNFSITGNYSNLFSQSGLSGGIDPDNNTIENELSVFEYNNDNVYFENRYSKNLQHNFNFSIDAEMVKNSPASISFYHYFNLDQLRQNEISSGKIDEKEIIFRNKKYTAYGSTIRQILNAGRLNIDARLNFEKVKYSGELFGNEKFDNSISLAAGLKYFLMDSALTPSIFFKNYKDDNRNYFSFGSDITANIDSTFIFYAGLSFTELPFSLLEKTITDKYRGNRIKKTVSSEIGIKYKNNFLSGNLSFFTLKTENHIFTSVYTVYDSAAVFSDEFYSFRNNTRFGTNLNFCLDVWKLQFDFNGTSYFYKAKQKIDFPEYTLFAGLYYKNILFSNNLNLKAGINFYAFSKTDNGIYDHENIIPVLKYNNLNSFSNKYVNSVTPSNYQLDLFISGRIQDRAQISIVWENLSNNNYYIIPFYPKQSRGIRFNILWDMYN